MNEKKLAELIAYHENIIAQIKANVVLYEWVEKSLKMYDNDFLDCTVDMDYNGVIDVTVSVDHLRKVDGIINLIRGKEMADAETTEYGHINAKRWAFKRFSLWVWLRPLDVDPDAPNTMGQCHYVKTGESVREVIEPKFKLICEDAPEIEAAGL